ncbi:oxidoreductase [Paenibacillus provencensis]|uniref:Oxidoreductase n=1 Tax=Paenibacillus provencensis TaxID=441151 RepID=A0ABW3Q045_9BACL|nr:oxidoreductase [Paenibacillus sp. MER 78]MCM3129346.1 oxidoreductase [Paenibacillus sp. MER 78]
MGRRKGLVIGATGLVGKQLVSQLLGHDEYEQVTALVRQELPISHPKLSQVMVNWDELEQHEEAFIGVDELFCCMGTTIKKAGSQAAFRKVDLEYPVTAARLALSHGARQMIAVTSMGADSTSRVFYTRTKGEFEDDIARLGYRGIHFLRPSLLLGDREEKRTGEKIGEWVLTLADPLLRKGRGREYRAVPCAHVAKAMIRAALRDQSGVYRHSNKDIWKLAEQQK